MPTSSPHARLIALHEDVQQKEYILEHEVYTLGRATACQIVVQRNLISRLHAKIERDGPRYVLSDVGSANGTFVNGRQIFEPYVLKDRDKIGLGAPAPLLSFADPDPTFVPQTRLRYDDQALAFFLDEQSVELSPAQFRLLRHLYQHTGTVCTRESCAQALWGRDYDPTIDAEALDRAVSGLRGQLRKLAPDSDFMETRRGSGYVLRP